MSINPPFTASFFGDELEMTREFYVEKLMGVPAEQSLQLQPLLKKLAGNIARHPYVLCHRDFHGQNIHIFNDKLYLIDFQDMRMGPDTYDAASLLRRTGVGRIIARNEIPARYYAEWPPSASRRTELSTASASTAAAISNALQRSIIIMDIPKQRYHAAVSVF